MKSYLMISSGLKREAWIAIVKLRVSSLFIFDVGV
jgi:hypothetical protein